MKTNFDKITENIDTLVKAMVTDVRCKSCIYGQEKRIGDRVEYDCYFDSDVCYVGKETCIEGVKEWLKQPLPMNEQFTDAEIQRAKELDYYGEEFLQYSSQIVCTNRYKHISYYDNNKKLFKNFNCLNIANIIKSREVKK